MNSMVFWVLVTDCGSNFIEIAWKRTTFDATPHVMISFDIGSCMPFQIRRSVLNLTKELTLPSNIYI